MAKFIAVLFVLLSAWCCASQSPFPYFNSACGTSNHVHKINGANNWFCAADDTPVGCYNRTQASTCTTCQVSIDKSSYWVPDLYYRWPNGTLSLVPDSKFSVSFIATPGTGNQSQPDFKPFPPGFQVISGFPFRRTYNPAMFTHTAVNWTCLADTPTEPSAAFPTATQKCTRGLRAQVWFPQCWDGKHLTSPEGSLHRHVSFPIESVTAGNCPSDHPVRLPMMYFEAIWDIAAFPHGEGVQPFVLAPGDSTGYGLHGAFINGWDTDILQAALLDPSCFGNSTSNGLNTAACKTLRPYLKSPHADHTCLPLNPIAAIEDLGINHVIPHLPGCQPITGPGPFGPVCNGSWPQNITAFAPTLRVLLRSKKTGQYVTATTPSTPVSADCPKEVLTYAQVFELIPAASGYMIQTETSLNFLTVPKLSHGPLLPTTRKASGAAEFMFRYHNGETAPTLEGAEASIFNLNSKQFVAVQDDDLLMPNAATDDVDETRFYVVDANAGVKDTRTLHF